MTIVEKRFKKERPLRSYQDWHKWYLEVCKIEGKNAPKIDKERTINCLSLFSGVGGIDIACDLCRIKTVAFCEMNPFGQKVLKQRWEKAFVVGKDKAIEGGIPIFEDITKLSGTREENKVILSYEFEETGTEKVAFEFEKLQAIQGGFPCQPYSSMGKRQGSDDPRALFGHIIRLLDTTRPRWFVGENVTGFLSLGLDRLLTNLDYVGYDTWTCSFPAASQNAPTMRHRVFIIGFSREYRNDTTGKAGNKSVGQNGTFTGGSIKFEDESRVGIEDIRIGIAGQAISKVDNEKEGTKNKESISNGDDRREEKNPIEVQDTGCNQKSIHTVSVCAGQSAVSSEREIWTPCDTGIYNGEDFFKPTIRRVRNGNGAGVSKDYIAQIMAAGNAVNPIQIYPLIRYLKYIDDLIAQGDSRIVLHDKIKRKASEIIANFSPEQRERLNKNFSIKPQLDDKNKLYSAGENYRPYLLYVHVKCDHKLCKKISAMKNSMKRGCKPLCNNVADGTEMWICTSFHNCFKTAQLFTEIVLNDEKATYIDNQPLIDEVFKQLIEEVTVKSNSDEIVAQNFLTKIDDNFRECQLGKF